MKKGETEREREKRILLCTIHIVIITDVCLAIPGPLENEVARSTNK